MPTPYFLAQANEAYGLIIPASWAQLPLRAQQIAFVNPEGRCRKDQLCLVTTADGTLRFGWFDGMNKQLLRLRPLGDKARPLSLPRATVQSVQRVIALVDCV